MLQVIVVAHDQEAELEVQTDAWSSYEELRELVVDAVPNMFRDSMHCSASHPLFYPDARRVVASRCSGRADARVQGPQRPLGPRQNEDAR